MGPKLYNSKKLFVPNFIFKGWEWCIWTITTIIHHQIWSADSTADITVIQSSKLSTLRSTFGRVPVNFFNCSGWNSFNFYIYFWISLKKLTNHLWKNDMKYFFCQNEWMISICTYYILGCESKKHFPYTDFLPHKSPNNNLFK